MADCTIESDLELRLPADYVPQESERISLYQQLDNMETQAQIEEFRNQLRDRFGAIPEISEELIRVVPLRSLARRLGIERLALKGGKMRVYFVGDDNKAYYQSAAFGKVLSYVQSDPLRCEIREVKGKRSILISRVTTVAEALSILKKMDSSVPVS